MKDSDETKHREMDDKDLLPLGARVRRGPDWSWENQDSNGPGTVVGHSPGYILIRSVQSDFIYKSSWNIKVKTLMFNIITYSPHIVQITDFLEFLREYCKEKFWNLHKILN